MREGGETSGVDLGYYLFISSSGKQLRVYSLTSNRKKSLNENCQGSFTTAPDKLRMHLYEITVNLSDALPCKVRTLHEVHIEGLRVVAHSNAHRL